MDAAVKKANWKLIGEAESFAAGCSRGRMELRLVDALKASMAEGRGLEARLAAGLEAASHDELDVVVEIRTALLGGSNV